MNKLTLGLTLLLTYGCGQPILNSSLSIGSVDSPAGCPEKPILNLDQQTVEEIDLDQSLVKSGRVTTTKSVGYRFDAESGQTLNYSTNDDVCIVIYTPDNQIIDSGELTTSGKYVLEVSAPQGTRAFSLSMSLTNAQSVDPEPTPVPQEPTSESPNVSPRRVNQPVHNISQDEALQIVQSWYEAKPQIFGPPYDLDLVDKLATGTLYYNTTKPDGSVAWLQNNNAYYRYMTSEITDVEEFSNSGTRPYIKVRIFEDLYLHGTRGIDRKNSGPYRGTFTYFFEQENGVWKIYDYKKVR